MCKTLRKLLEKAENVILLQVNKEMCLIMNETCINVNLLFLCFSLKIICIYRDSNVSH
jgi:hypothetical protein